MPNLEGKDRRIYERFPVKLSLRYLRPDPNREGQAQTSDTSANGIGLNAEEELPAGTPLKIWLLLPNTDRTLYMRGEVIWSSMIEANRYRMGVSLEKTDLMDFPFLLKLVSTLKNSQSYGEL